MELVPLHHHKDFLSECADLLNMEWPRSQSARIHSLEKSCDQLPCSLLLIGEFEGRIMVIGHSRLSPVVGRSAQDCLIESVIVQRHLRGKGYGRELMVKTEEWARMHGYTTIHLTTTEKKDFYKSLGYVTSTAVLTVGAGNAHLLSSDLIKMLAGTNITNPSSATTPHTAEELFQANDTSTINTKEVCSSKDVIGSDQSHSVDVEKTKLSTKPKVPPSVSSPLGTCNRNILNQHSPPPPPPLPVSSSSSANINSRIITRLDANSVTWMKKTI